MASKAIGFGIVNPPFLDTSSVSLAMHKTYQRDRNTAHQIAKKPFFRCKETVFGIVNKNGPKTPCFFVYNENMSTTQTYGAFIRERRKSLHISQQALADDLQCTPQAISKYENDKASLYLGLLGPLARALQVDITSFLLKKEEKNNTFADEGQFDISKFSQCLSYLREREHLTQKALSSKINIPIFKITKWENGKALPSLEEFQQIADFYHLSYDALYFGTIERKEETNPIHQKKKPPVLLIVLSSLAVVAIVLISTLVPLLVKPEPSLPSSSLPSSSLPSSIPSSNSSGRPPFIVSVDIEV